MSTTPDDFSALDDFLEEVLTADAAAKAAKAVGTPKPAELLPPDYYPLAVVCIRTLYSVPSGQLFSEPSGDRFYLAKRRGQSQVLTALRADERKLFSSLPVWACNRVIPLQPNTKAAGAVIPDKWQVTLEGVANA